jgi:hypothetical protein
MTPLAHFTFFESNDPVLLTEYFELRERLYRRHYPNLPPHFGREEPGDRPGPIVLAFHGRQLAGGARLTLSTPDNPRRMPLEDGGFELRSGLPELDLDHQSYGEISRLAVEPAFGGDLLVSFGLGRELCVSAARRGVDILFSMCPEGPARINRRNSRKCGVEFRICQELPTPFGIPMRLCVYLGILRAVNGGRCMPQEQLCSR